MKNVFYDFQVLGPEKWALGGEEITKFKKSSKIQLFTTFGAQGATSLWKSRKINVRGGSKHGNPQKVEILAFSSLPAPRTVPVAAAV